MTQTTQAPYAIGELLLSGTVPQDTFSSLIQQYQIPPHKKTPTFILVEEQPRRVIQQDERQNLLRFEIFDPAFDLTAYTSGRIFHELGELRWERQQTNVQIVYTGQKEWQPTLSAPFQEELKDYTFEDRMYLLFGKRLAKDQLDHIGPVAKPGDFAEVRIPRLLRYPQPDELPNKDRLYLVACEYMDATTGITVAYRFKGVSSDLETTGGK